MRTPLLFPAAVLAGVHFKLWDPFYARTDEPN